MPTSEYAPQYYVRIFPDIIGSGEQSSYSSWEFELNPQVLSISTDKDIDNPSGSWSIEMNYKSKSQANTSTGFDSDDWFMKIEPMDYIEIFMRRERIISDVKDIDKNSPTYNKIIRKQIEVPFGRFDLKDPNKPLIYHNNENIVFTQQFGQKDLKVGDFTFTGTKGSIPLTILEKTASPDLIMSGFVDSIENKFSLGQGGPNNRLVISGRDVAKFLQEHQVFFKYIDQTFLAQEAMTSECLPTLKAADVLNFILVLHLQSWLAGETKPIKKETKEDSKWVANNDVAQIAFYEKKNLKEHKEVTKVVRLNKTAFTNQIYWDIAERSKKNHDENDSAIWARIEDRSPRILRAASPFVEGPLWSILKQQIAPEQNELWVDETGNIVFRKYIDAWTQPDVEVYHENYYTQQPLHFDGLGNKINEDIPALRFFVRPNDRPWIKITESEIMSWNLKKSDNNLKTLVTVQSSTNIKYGQATLDARLGQVPLTQEVLDRAAEWLKVDGAAIADIETLQFLYLYNISSFDLKEKDGIRRFWNKFGVRPITVLDQYSDTLPEFFENALAMFEKFANLWWTGTLTVKGDQKYKVGRILYIQGLDLTFYITGVSHRFVWGDSWTTTLKLTRGSKKQDISDHRLFLKTTSSSSDVLENAYTNPREIGAKMQLNLGNQVKMPLR